MQIPGPYSQGIPFRRFGVEPRICILRGDAAAGSAGPTPGETLAAARWLRPGLTEGDLAGRAAGNSTVHPVPEGRQRQICSLSPCEGSRGEAGHSLGLDSPAQRAWGLPLETLVWQSHQVLLGLLVPGALRCPMRARLCFTSPGRASEFFLSFCGWPGLSHLLGEPTSCIHAT